MLYYEELDDDSSKLAGWVWVVVDNDNLPKLASRV